MHVTLAPTWERFVEQKIAQGAYASADDVIAASLVMLQTGDDEEWKAGARKKIEEGLHSVRAGRVYDEAVVDLWMEEQKAAWRAQRGGA